MSLPAIGVVIPCYKAEHTLRQTVESVLQGAPDNLQLVLVEDGSPDGTGALCDALAAQDPRVTALHQPNGGASAARNAGLDTLCRSGAEWVLFVDADDTLLPGLWQVLPAAFDAQPGLILYGMVRASGPSPNPLAPGCYAGPAALGDALDPLLFESGYLAAPYPKLFRLDVIRRNKLRFDPRLKINEDVLFNLQYLRFLLFLQKNSAIYCLAGVYYNQNDMLAGSLSRSLRGDLLDAEAVTRPVLEAFLTDAKLPAPEIDRLVQISRVRAALNQYGLLTGCPGRMPFAQRRQLFARILQDADARAALHARLTADPNRLLALPYRLGVFLHSAWLLAAYTQLKNRFL